MKIILRKEKKIFKLDYIIHCLDRKIDKYYFITNKEDMIIAANTMQYYIINLSLKNIKDFADSNNYKLD